jgi:hypothetical protein
MAGTTLTAAEVLARLKAQHSSHYLDLYNVMKGVTLAVAGVSFLEIVVRHWSSGRLILWLVAFAGSVLTYYGAVAGATLLNQRPGLPDIMFPMLLSVAELMLIYRPGLGLDDHHPCWMPTDWFALFSAWGLLCGCVIVCVSLGLRAGLRSKAYADDLIPIIENYRIRLRRDYLSALGAASLSLAVYVFWRIHLWPATRQSEVVVAALMFGFIAGGIYSQRSASQEIDNQLYAAL